jgi:hypothetical protein
LQTLFISSVSLLCISTINQHQEAFVQHTLNAVTMQSLSRSFSAAAAAPRTAAASRVVTRLPK